MRTVASFVVCIILCLGFAQFAFAQGPAQPGSTAAAAALSDDLHFVSVLGLQGEIVKMDPENQFVIIKNTNGKALTLDAWNTNDIESLKVGDRVTVQYFEGAQVRPKKQGEAVQVSSLADGIIGASLRGSSGKERDVVASVDAVDPVNQEITLKGADGKLDTILVTNPRQVYVKVGDEVVITRHDAVALSIRKAA